MATSTDNKGPFKVGIVIGSVRSVRSGNQIAQFVLDTIKAHHTSATSPANAQVDFSILDIAGFNLELTPEAKMPMAVQERPAGYATASTRVWSTAVASIDAFVFVTPEYNWGIPAGLKNAIDLLYHEWSGKPAMVVSYGFVGSVSAASLLTVLGGGVSMRTVKKPVTMMYPSMELGGRSVQGLDLGLDAAKEDGPWADQRAKIVEAWEETLVLLGAGVGKPATLSEGLAELWSETIAGTTAFEAKKAASS